MAIIEKVSLGVSDAFSCSRPALPRVAAIGNVANLNCEVL